jgi:hypothetical protein
MSDGRDTLYLTLIGEAIVDIRRRLAAAHYDSFLTEGMNRRLRPFDFPSSVKA